jgi:hypothetical protein
MRKLLIIWGLCVGLSGQGLAAEAAPEAAPPAMPEASGPEQPAPKPTESTALEDIETILTQPLGPEEYVEAERCLSRYRFDSVDIIDDSHVLFRRRGKAWLNTLRRPCIGLRRRDVPQFEYRASSSQLCNLDSFVAIDSSFSGFHRTSASCALGDFQPVTREQVALIKATVESRKGRGRTKKKKAPGDQ